VTTETLLAGLDVGTTRPKAGVYRADGTVVAEDTELDAEVDPAQARRDGVVALKLLVIWKRGGHEAARAHIGIPVFRVDAPMAAEAAKAAKAAATVRDGGRVGVLATVASTLQPTQDLLRREGRSAEIHASVCPGAADALRGGDTERHDEIVGAEVRRLATEADVLVLAQASMARVVAGLPAEEISVPVLTSPRSGVRQLRPFAVG
jgi:hypothetical protein